MFTEVSVPYFPVGVEEADGEPRFQDILTGESCQINSAAACLLACCDGYRTFGEIVTELAAVYHEEPATIAAIARPVLEQVTRTGLLWWRERRMNWYDLPAPMAVLWDLTGRCNLSCRHCIVSSDIEGPDGLSTDESRRLVDEMAAFGVRQLILSGGEPLVRPDFLELCRYAAGKGLSLQVATNATLVTETLAEELSKLGAMAQVSLDSRDPDVHDEFRGRPGAWLRTMDGIRYLVNAGVPVTMAATVTTMSIDAIPDLYRLAAQTGITTFRILPFVPGGRGASWDSLEVSPAAMRDLTSRLTGLRDDIGLQIAPMEFECTLQPPVETPIMDGLPIGCDGARAYCTVTSSGDVLPCNYFAGVKTENVKDKPFAEIWKTSAFLNYFRSLVVDDLDGPCKQCDHLGTCRGSCLAANFVHRSMFQSNCHCWLADEASKVLTTG